MVSKTIKSGVSSTGQMTEGDMSSVNEVQQVESSTPKVYKEQQSLAHQQPARKRQRTETVMAGKSADQLNLMHTPVKDANGNHGSIDKIKSPSDTTIYAPGLNKLQRNDNMIDKISNFVETVRLEMTQGDRSPMVQRDEPQPGTSRDDDLSPQAREALDTSNRLILDSERLKATVNLPRGKDYVNTSYERNYDNQAPITGKSNGQGDGTLVFPASQCLPTMDKDNDDDFFHLTCHIEPNLRSKIEKGEFVVLDKLLPKNHLSHKLEDDNRMEIVNRDRMTYFVPASDCDNTINGIKKWDQAFRVYAAIYCKCNPSRSAEIWQYIYTIHTAASSFQWDNVA